MFSPISKTAAKTSDDGASSESLAVGGQAVIEGVMIRSPYAVATAIRRANGDIEVNAYPYRSLTRRFKALGFPVIRGAVVLCEALCLGVKSLNWSAEKYAEDDEKEKITPLTPFRKFFDRVLSILSIIAALLLGLALFMFIPYWVSGVIREAGGSQLIFHAIAGSVRIALFLLYLYAISLWKDVRRVFQYHGAEHKSIFAFEKNGEIDSAAALLQSRFHPRCGTSFLLITAIVVILLFAVIDTLLIPFIGEYKSPFHRLLVHIPFIPLVAGMSYEVLKLSGKKSENGVWKIIIKPGLWLQRFTTREPDSRQIEVAAAAIKASLDCCADDN